MDRPVMEPRGAEPPASATREWLFDRLPDLLCVDAGKLRDEATLADLGADSLDVIELAMNAEDRFACRLADDAFTIDTDLADIARVIDAAIGVAARKARA